MSRFNPAKRGEALIVSVEIADGFTQTTVGLDDTAGNRSPPATAMEAERLKGPVKAIEW